MSKFFKYWQATAVGKQSQLRAETLIKELRLDSQLRAEILRANSTKREENACAFAWYDSCRETMGERVGDGGKQLGSNFADDDARATRKFWDRFKCYKKCICWLLIITWKSAFNQVFTWNSMFLRRLYANKAFNFSRKGAHESFFCVQASEGANNWIW